jgi:hypothetical protein
MNSDGALGAKSTRLGWSLRGAAAIHPGAVAAAVYGLVAIAALGAAYLSLFTQFAVYDDEGALLVSIKAFVHGAPLYRDVWSIYGPFYYELFGGFFSLTGVSVTTDVSRSIVMVVWVGASLLLGLAAHRLTDNLWLGATGMIAAFETLEVLIAEPMHPHGLCALLIAAFVFLAVCGPRDRLLGSGAGCGALLAALVLTKVNLGLFAIAAVVLATALTVEPSLSRGWFRWPVVLAFLAMPLAVLNRDLDLAWVREMVVLEVLVSVAVIVAAWPLHRRGEPGAGFLPWVRGAIAGFAAAFGAIVAIILLTGPSLGDVYDGVVRDPLGVPDLLRGPFPLPAAALSWAVAAVAGALLATRLRTPRGRPSIVPGLLRLGVGLAIWLATAGIVLVGLNPSSRNPDVVPMLLAWVAAIPPAGAQESERKRFLRVLLPALAVAETLQAYPVPGAQLGIAAVCFVPVGALCLADALVDLRAWSSARGGAALAGFPTAAGIVTLAVAAVFALQAIVLPGFTNAVLHHRQPRLELPGAEMMRLPAPLVEEYSRLVELLREHECTIFISYPGFNSLYLWSGLEAPAPRPPAIWMKALDDAKQRRAVAELRASPRPCAIRNEAIAAVYVSEPLLEKPLIAYIFENFEPAENVGAFEFMVPKAAAQRGL